MTGASVDLTRPLVELADEHFKADLLQAVEDAEGEQFVMRPDGSGTEQYNWRTVDENRPLADIIRTLGKSIAERQVRRACHNAAVRAVDLSWPLADLAASYPDWAIICAMPKSSRGAEDMDRPLAELIEEFGLDAARGKVARACMAARSRRRNKY